MSRLFGAGSSVDAFVIGFRIPNLTRDLFAEGALSSAFVPTFVDYLQNKGKEEAAHLANLVATAIILFVGMLCVVGMVASPWMVPLLTQNWVATNPEKVTEAVKLTQIMFPFLLLVSLAAQAMGILNACNQFAVPAFSSTWFNIGSVLSGLLLGFVMGPWLGITRIEGMAYGIVIGGALQLLCQAPSLYKQGFRFRFAFDFSHPGLRHIIRLMGPAIIGNSSVQINVLVNTFSRPASTIQFEVWTGQRRGCSMRSGLCSCRWGCLAWQSRRPLCPQSDAAPRPGILRNSAKR